MVSIEVVRASNASLKKLQPGLVALFVGATSGIGEYTLKQFFRQTTSPRIYFVGRNQDAANRILADLKPLNPAGSATFIRKDITLLSSVREICEDLLAREKSLNLLFLTPGFLSLKGRDPSSEHLDRKFVANYYARLYFTDLLLPLLQAAAAKGQLARVVSVIAAGREGPIALDDLELRHNFSLNTCMKHSIVMTDFAFEELAKKEENKGVSFVHAFPGWVKTGFGKDAGALVKIGVKVLYTLLGPWFTGPEESGERHLYVASSAAYGPREGEGDTKGVRLGEGEEIARGSDGVGGSGAYLVGETCQVVGNEKVLEELRAQGAGGKIWEHTLEVFERGQERD
ncbi:hypothetical protein MMC08_002017 [Hypocenomyce scalaris]|nr:hypothetical protein [Hypocenomyce scalaris]